MDGQPMVPQYEDAYNAKQAAIGVVGGPLTRETTRQRLTRAKAEMERRIADIDKAVALLDKNPDTEELLNLLGRVGY
jgi:hypothetical protein